MPLEKDTILELQAQSARVRSINETARLEVLFDEEKADTYNVSHDTLNHIRGTMYRLEYTVRCLEHKLEDYRKLINTMEQIYDEDMAKK